MKAIKEAFQKYKAKFSKVLSVLKLPSFAVLIGFLGAYAGSHGTSKSWRRLGISVIVALTAYVSSGFNSEIGWVMGLWNFSCLSLWLSYSMGYGIPDDSYPPKGDSGSMIGRFWTMLFRKYTSIIKAHRLANYFTRSTVSIVKCITLLSIPLLKGNWICYGIGALGILLINALVSWRPLKSYTYTIFGKKVHFLLSDIITFTVEGLCYYIMIFWSIL